jgi:hypothetical protein
MVHNAGRRRHVVRLHLKYCPDDKKEGDWAMRKSSNRRLGCAILYVIAPPRQRGRDFPCARRSNDTRILVATVPPSTAPSIRRCRSYRHLPCRHWGTRSMGFCPSGMVAPRAITRHQLFRQSFSACFTSSHRTSSSPLEKTLKRAASIVSSAKSAAISPSVIAATYSTASSDSACGRSAN